MKLLRARFKNFRLLRDLEIEFSTDPVKKLTVFRAENETGKTTILTALQWALYGDDALPGKGAEYRLHPIDWDTDDSTRVPIDVTVEFEVTKHRRTGNGYQEHRKQYRIIRSTVEELTGDKWRRHPAVPKLYHLAENGAEPIDSPEALIDDELPPELREVFFTDGDRALSFIEADVALSTKRARVEKAIRSLLGLGVIENAIKHAKQAAAEINNRVRQAGGNQEISRIAGDIAAFTSEIEKLDGEIKDARDQFAVVDAKFAEMDKEINAALQKGNKDELRGQREKEQKEVKRLDELLAKASKKHSELFKSKAVASELLSPLFAKAAQKLKELERQGKIPNTTIPVLKDRLELEICICGETLEDSDPAGHKRREHINHLIEESRKADEIQTLITHLYYGSQELLTEMSDPTNSWRSLYASVFDERDKLHQSREEAGNRLRSIETQIDKLPDTDIQGLREARRQFLEQRDRYNRIATEKDTQRSHRKQLLDQRAEEMSRLLRQQEKGERFAAELEVTNDVMKVLQSSYERITSEELHKVSDLMNTIFLKMIGADPEQGSIIKKAEISKEFDIIVYGPNNRTLNPDRDLNGASRRALTLAFILSLTKISEVEAPNIIDTPLGMMSGYVKRSVLKTAIQESAQIVLFLTRAEIEGCEEIIDECAGTVTTLTNPAHYPRMLMHKPPTQERKIISCECSHRETCNLCERRQDIEELALAS
jgi:DNA sulfur modification protein DndD